jgi:hypothetical protein
MWESSWRVMESGLAGYLCASACKFNRHFPLLTAMMQQFDGIDYGGWLLASFRAFI